MTGTSVFLIYSPPITEFDVALQSGISVGEYVVQGRLEIYSCDYPVITTVGVEKKSMLRLDLPYGKGNICTEDKGKKQMAFLRYSIHVLAY
jgi:hypothetical protein